MNELIRAMIDSGDCPPQILEDCIRDHNGGELVNVFVVSGESGDYSGTRVWLVSVYLTQEPARQLVNHLNAWLLSVDLLKDGECRYRRMPHPRPSPPEDPNFEYDNSYGTKYSYSEIPLKG